MLREVTDLPMRHVKGFESYVARDIIDFARSDMAVAELVVEGREGHNVYIAARNFVRQHRDLCPGVAVTRRGERVYLIREDGQ
jgi:hypothetical protein